MWTPQFIGIAVGFALIIIAIMGGGVEIKEIKIPRLSGWARFGSALLGAVIALASSDFNFAPTQAAPHIPPANRIADDGAANGPDLAPTPPSEETNSQGAATEPPLPPPPPAPAGFVTIIDRLGENQEYERIEVYLNGVAAGRVAVDQNERMDRLRIPADNSAARYHLEGTQRSDQGAGSIIHRLEGEGTISLRPGAVFELILADQQRNPDDDILDIDLRQEVEALDGTDESAVVAADQGE